MNKKAFRIIIFDIVICLASFTLGYHAGHDNADIPEFSKKLSRRV